MARIAPHRRLKRLRALLALLGSGAALCVAAALRFDSTARGIAAVGALACVIAWLVVLEAEGRMADNLERRHPRRLRAARPKSTLRPATPREPRRRAA